MPSLVSSALLAFAGYSILNISQAVQKIGLQRLPTSRWIGGSLWIAALIASGVSFGIVFAAIAIGRVSVVGAMAGTGLVGLSVFSSFVMGESISWGKIGAIAAILLGAAMVALFPEETEERLRPFLLWGIPIVGVLAAGITWWALPAGGATGVFVGGFSGFLGAYSQLFQREVAVSVSFSEGPTEILRQIAGNPLNLVWIGLSAASMVVIQFAYRHGEASRIIPTYTGVFVMTPVIGGVVVFGESLSASQWVGVAVLLFGTIALTRGRRG